MWKSVISLARAHLSRSAFRLQHITTWDRMRAALTIVTQCHSILTDTTFYMFSMFLNSDLIIVSHFFTETMFNGEINFWNHKRGVIVDITPPLHVSPAPSYKKKAWSVIQRYDDNVNFVCDIVNTVQTGCRSDWKHDWFSLISRPS